MVTILDRSGSMTKWEELFTKQMIAGKWQSSLDAEQIDVENPATRQIIAHIPAGGVRDAEFAIDCARKAFPSWANTSLEERISLMEMLFECLQKKTYDIVFWESAELGMPTTYVRRKHCALRLSALAYPGLY